MSETTPETSPTDVDETTSTTGTDDGVHAETRDDAGEGEPKKRRRRRRGGRGRKRGKRTGEAGGEPAAESADAPEAGEAAAVDADAEPREDVEPRDPEPRRDDPPHEDPGGADPAGARGQARARAGEDGHGQDRVVRAPVLHRMEKGVAMQALILAPTRELAVQIRDDIDQLQAVHRA
jgi:hypothetical protein